MIFFYNFHELCDFQIYTKNTTFKIEMKFDQTKLKFQFQIQINEPKCGINKCILINGVFIKILKTILRIS